MYANIEQFLTDAKFQLAPKNKVDEFAQHIDINDKVVSVWQKEIPACNATIVAIVKDNDSHKLHCANLHCHPQHLQSQKVHIKVIGECDDAEKASMKMIHELLIANNLKLNEVE